MTTLAGRLVALAELMELDFESTIALPSAITSAARKTMMSDAAMVEHCFGNPELRDYLAGICRATDVEAALA